MYSPWLFYLCFVFFVIKLLHFIYVILIFSKFTFSIIVSIIFSVVFVCFVKSQSHAASIESEREVFHVTPDLAGPGTDDDDDDGDNNHHNLQWYARIPRDGFPDGSELQTAKNSSDDLHRFKCPPSTQCSAPISPPGCTCNALDSGHSTMVTTSGRSSAGESYRMVEPYGHHNHHRHPPPPRACVLSVDRRNHPCAVQYHKERSSHEEPLVQPLFQCHPPRHKQLQIVPPVSIHGQSRCGFGCHDYHDAGSLYNQLTCTCSPDECGFSPVEIPGSGSNRISRESEISFPPPPSSDYLSQQSSGGCRWWWWWWRRRWRRWRWLQSFCGHKTTTTT